MFSDFLACTNAPAPDSRLEPYFWHPEVLRDLAWSIDLGPLDGDTDPRPQLTAGSDYHRAPFYRVRYLSPLGIYPNLQIASRQAIYTVRHSQPYLITRNSPMEERKWSYQGELGSDWSRHETRLATALSCTEWGGFLTYLSRHRRQVRASAVAHIPEVDRVSFLIEYASLAEMASRRRPVRDTSTSILQELPGSPTFAGFRPYARSARTFAENFLVSHLLLLRTARHYLKASMLWHTDGFDDDAMANILFALEGCLLLFQEVEGERTDRIDRRALKRIFPRIYDNGKWLYGYVEEVFGWGGTRAQLVHPQLALSEGWVPFLMADDYYEYHHLVRAFLTYLVTGESIEDYELAA